MDYIGFAYSALVAGGGILGILSLFNFSIDVLIMTSIIYFQDT